MKQILNKIGLFTLVLTLLFTLFTNTNVNAKSDRIIYVDERETTQVYGQMTVNSQKIKTINNGLDKPLGDADWNRHSVHWADFDPSNEVKVVTYSSNSRDKWKKQTTKAAAKEWERNNPGWIVVAGINGDFFDIQGTGEPTNTFMQDGDFVRAEKHTGWHRQSIGWNKDGSVIVGDPTISGKMFLKVLAEDKKTPVKETVIETYNSNPSATGITLYTKDTAVKDADLTGYTVIDCTYEICRISGSGYAFVKGTVGDKITPTSSKPELEHFYLASKDGSVEKACAKGDYIKCEYSFTDKWENVQTSMGYVYQIAMNGKPNPDFKQSTDGFIKTTHPRTTIGFRPDGSTVFMVFEGRGLPSDWQVGASLYEAAEILTDLGCETAFNLDGGGSSTLIMRNTLGGFDCVNRPSDGSERSDGNHCLVVMRDPGFVVNTSEKSFNEVNLNLDITNQAIFDKTKNIKVTVNNVTKDYKGEALKFDGLRPETKYDVKITYDNADTYDETKTTTKTYMTNFYTDYYHIPSPGLEIKNITTTSFDIVKNMTLPQANLISDVKIHVDNDVYDLGSGEVQKITNLIKNTEYEIFFEYKVNDPSGLVFENTTQKFTVKTAEFDIPTVGALTEKIKTSSTLSVHYEFTDNDDVVTRAYLTLNGEVYKEVKSKSGQITLTNLDFDKNTYELKFVIEYVDKKDKTVTVESEKLVYEVQAPVEPEPAPAKKCGHKGALIIVEALTAVSVIGVVLKKKR